MEFDLSRVARTMTRNLRGTDIMANNLANINTHGYKRDDHFYDQLIMYLGEVGAQRYTDFRQGELFSTDNPLDLGLANDGFFVVETPEGQAFTRNGHFSVSEDGFVQTAQGFFLTGENGPISVLGADGITAGKVQISRNGEIFMDDALVDQLLIARVENPGELEKVGSNLFRVSPGSGTITYLIPKEIEVRQGMLEGSNVDPVGEMVGMIELQRQYDSAQRVATAIDQLLGRATQLGDYR